MVLLPLALLWKYFCTSADPVECIPRSSPGWQVNKWWRAFADLPLSDMFAAQIIQPLVTLTEIRELGFSAHRWGYTLTGVVPSDLRERLGVLSDMFQPSKNSWTNTSSQGRAETTLDRQIRPLMNMGGDPK